MWTPLCLFLFGCDVILSIPFRGNKRYWLKFVRQLIEENGYKKTVEPFGGSGVLTTNLNAEGLIEHGYINDYDHYFDEYDRIIDIKESLINMLFDMGAVKDHDNKLPLEYQTALQNAVRQYDGKTRYLLMNNFCYGNFNYNVEAFCYFTNNTDMEKERNYLKWYRENTIDHLDFKDFITKYQCDDGLLILDPPYMNSSTGFYAGTFDERQFEEMVALIPTVDMDVLLFEDGRSIDYIESLLERYGLEYEKRTKQFALFTHKNNIHTKRRLDLCYFIKNTPTT